MTPQHSRSIQHLPNAVLVSGFLLVLLVLWTLLSLSGILPEYLLPTPSKTAQAIWDDLWNADFWRRQFAATLLVVLVGFILATITGISLAILIVWNRTIERAIYPVIVAFQTMPKIAMAPLILVWLGYGNTSKFVIAGLVAFFPVIVNTIVGLKAVDKDQVLFMNALRTSKVQMLRHVAIPNALPYIFAGLDVAIIFAVIGAIVAEFLGSANGLGSLVIVRQTNVDIAGLFSVLFFLGVMGSTLHMIVAKVGQRATFWMRIGEED